MEIKWLNGILNICMWNNWKIWYKKQPDDVDAWWVFQDVFCHESPHWMVKSRSEKLTY